MYYSGNIYSLCNRQARQIPRVAPDQLQLALNVVQETINPLYRDRDCPKLN